ncbi:phospholipid-transporting ATPase ABCA1-like isoform X2 [Neocloeon triangulifer]|uniref:phospholipid-transporting ATPase ABCA1-like isoform X2 n=1 Tax=Neocloeon triangulifer TaxID=2078957 RepID=UPI00286F125E|nr:phospholipid-transporting ATPase ABCA1-like isoform X2 [Neocloeon triangulifer]
MGHNRISPVQEQISQIKNMGTPVSMRLRRLGVLVWKNSVLVRKRHWFLTLLETLLPLILFAIVAFIRANSASLGTKQVDSTTWFHEYSQLDLRRDFRDKHILFAPENNFTKRLMERAKIFGDIPDVEGMKSEVAMLVRLSALANETRRRYHGSSVDCIVFQGKATESLGSKVPKKLEYKIRVKENFKTEHLFNTISVGPDIYRSYPYHESGFLGLQLIINKAFIELAQSYEHSSTPEDIQDQMFLQAMPYPPYMDDNGYAAAVKTLLPFLSMFSFIILCTTVTKRVVEEKQSGAKELMKLMGMEKWAFWVGWMIDALLVRVVTIILIVWLLVTAFDEASGAVLNESSPTLLFVLLMMYCASSVTLLFAISTFFSRPVIAMTVSFVIWFASLVIPMQYVEEKNPGFYTKMLFNIFPNMGLMFTFDSVLNHEKRGVGAQWSNLFGSGSGSPRDLSLFNVMIMFVVDIILYSLITWYVSEVHPGEFGYKQSYLFFASKSYWCGEKEKSQQIEAPDEINQDNYERPLTVKNDDKSVGIIIRNLKKTYPGQIGRPPVQAVRGVSLDIYKGEITALLGHNGAGKTTTMSILTGMIAPSSGSVQILGHDLKKELSDIRQSLGLCPQHNLLFGELTVHQHLVFFAMLKGSSRKDATNEAEELLQTVRLADKKLSYVSELSGGMKRKLSLAIALIGGSKVVMLDEPTSGLDPEARREIWDLLLQLRKERTILLSTHFMEEADVLGDTIAIMSHGKVECCGSAIYLKRLYGAGYHLHILKKNNCKEDELVKTVQEALPEATVERSSQDEVDKPNRVAKAGPVTFTLPANKVEKFAILFDALEKSKKDLGIASMGVSVTTLDEVFLKVGELSAKKYASENNDYTDKVDAQETPTHSTQNLQKTKASGCSLFAEQMRALLEKKFIVTKRQRLFLLLQFLLPTLMTLAAVWSTYAALSVDVDSEPSFPINLSQYGSRYNLRALYSAGSSEKARNSAKIFSSLVRNEAEPEEVVDNIMNRLIQTGTENLANFRSNYIVAARFNDTTAGPLNVVGLHSYDAYHSAAISMNLISNALLKYHASYAYEIATWNHPLPTNTEGDHINKYIAMSAAVGIIWLSLAHLGWIFATAVNLVLPLQERTLGARQLQFMAGCPLYLIWLSYFLVDVLVTTLVAVVVLVVIFPFDTQHIFTAGTEGGVLFVVFFLYGISGTLFAYFISFLKDNVPAAFGFIIFITVFFGGIINIIIYTLELFPNWENWGTASRIIAGLLMPHSALISSLTHFSGTAVYNSMCRTIPPSVKEVVCSQRENQLAMCCENICKPLGVCFEKKPYFWSSSDKKEDDWTNNHGAIGQELIYFAVGSVFWVCVVLLLDSGLLGRISERVLSFLDQKLHPRDEIDSPGQDEDVAEEMKEAEKCLCNNGMENIEQNVGDVTDSGDSTCYKQQKPILAVSSLRKQYGVPVRKGRFPAVRSVSFRVDRGECFGLLGVNGAGKSTTFRMLTGSAPPTEGDALLGGSRLKMNRRNFLSGLGYCPQFDAHLGMMTGRETLQLYARLRGVPQGRVDSDVQGWLEALGLNEYANRPTASYSGGNQRKLSAAVALIGEPPVALLDEPTSGVDPIARRQLWQVLDSCQKAGQSIVFTSHSMDECEALCSRLGIMVAGKLVCVGPIGRLKDKYGQGYTLMVKLKSLSWESDPIVREEAGKQLSDLKDDLENKFRPCDLVDEHQGLLHYQIKENGRKWSELFNNMETLKKSHSILEDYTLSETTLEQVFLSFAQHGDQAKLVSRSRSESIETTHV